MFKRSMLKQGYTIGFFLLATGGLCLAQSEPQSLADIAKKSRSEKKIAATLTATTLTDDNFVRRVPVDSTSKPGVPLAASAGEQQSTAAGNSGTPAKGDAKTGKAAEALNKEELKKEELKKQLDSFKADRDGWNKSAKRYEDLLANEPDEFRRQMYQDALNNDRQNVSVYQKKIDEAEGKSGTGSGESADQQASGSGNKP
jgi:hypothetical protein